MPIGKTAFHVAPLFFVTARPPGLVSSWNPAPRPRVRYRKGRHKRQARRAALSACQEIQPVRPRYLSSPLSPGLAGVTRAGGELELTRTSGGVLNETYFRGYRLSRGLRRHRDL